MTGKTMYYLLVKVLNQNRLEDGSDSPRRAHLALTEAQGPEWRALYKEGGGTYSGGSPFCPQRETVVHCLLECGLLTVSVSDSLVWWSFLRWNVRPGNKYNSKNKIKCQLLNFVLGQAKMEIYLWGGTSLKLTRRRRMLMTRLKTDFTFFILTSNVKDFEKMWCLKPVLCSVKKDQLVFGHILDWIWFDLMVFWVLDTL